MDSAPLDGQVALITGGGTGIGLACAEALIADGAAVLLAARDLNRLDGAAAELRSRYADAKISTVACDVTNESSVSQAVRAASGLGALKIVVVNAGFGSAAPFHKTTLDDWGSVLATNLTGAFLTMREAVEPMVAAGGGSMVAVSSIAAVETHRFMTPYSVSKAGLEMLVKQVADELGPSGIRANAVRPGLVPTDATAGMMSIPEIVDDYRAQMPLGREGTTDDIASLVRFLAGPESSWITGTCISADGGHHLRRGPNLDPLAQALYGDDCVPQAPC